MGKLHYTKHPFYSDELLETIKDVDDDEFEENVMDESRTSKLKGMAGRLYIDEFATEQVKGNQIELNEESEREKQPNHK